MKNRNLIYIFLFFLSTFQLFAQIPDTTWSKTFGGVGGDYGHAVRQTMDEGYIIVGSTNSYGAGGYDVWIIKTDIMGNEIWTKTIGGANHDYGFDIQQTTDSGYVITGHTRIYDIYDGDLWLIKTNSLGDTIWTKTYGGDYRDDGTSVQQTIDGGYIITGSTRSIFPPDYFMWLIKTDSLGDLQWSKNYSDGFGSSVKQTLDGGYILSGSTPDYEGYQVAWLLKTDSLGVVIWSKTYSRGWGSSVQQTSDSGYIVTGIIEKGLSNDDVLLIKTDSSGDTLWTKTYGEEEFDNWGRSVQQCTDGGYIITGSTQSPIGETGDLWLLKTDSSGDTIWTRTFGGPAPDAGYSVQQTIQGGYIITGFTESYGMGGADVWLINYPEPPVGVIDDVLVDNFILEQNYPNPFNPSTSIKYQISELSFIIIKVYDVLGKEVATLINDEKPSGSYEIEFDAIGLPSGIYFYRLQASSFIETKKMVLIR